MIAIRCPDCLHPGTVPPSACGRKVRCVKCRCIFAVAGPVEPSPDVEEVAWSPGLPAPGETTVFDLSKLDEPEPKLPSEDEAEDDPEPIRQRSRDREEEGVEYEPPLRRGRKRVRISLTIYISLACLAVSFLAMWLVFSKIAELNRIKYEINQKHPTKRIR